MTAFFPATGKDLTSVLGAHPLQEAVHAFATAVMRLKRPLHGVLLLLGKNSRLEPAAHSP